MYKVLCFNDSFLYVSDGRTDPVLDDVSQAFRLLGVSLSELEDYVNNLEPVAFAHQTPLYPVSKNNVLQFPQLGARDAEERKDYIPDHMPPLVSLQEGQNILLYVYIYNSLYSISNMLIKYAHVDSEESEVESTPFKILFKTTDHNFHECW